MSKKLYIVLTLTSVIGISILLHSLLNFSGITAYLFVFWVLVACLCESLPVYFSKERVVTVTFAVLLALQLSHGTYIATIVAAISSVFFIIKNDDGTYKHTFNLPFYKTLMNFSNFTISIYLSGLLYDHLIDKFEFLLNMPYFIFVVFLYLTAVFVINAAFVTIFMNMLVGSPVFKTWLNSSLWALPNFIAISPIGFFIYKLYQLPSGSVYIL